MAAKKEGLREREEDLEEDSHSPPYLFITFYTAFCPLDEEPPMGGIGSHHGRQPDGSWEI